MTEDIFPRRGVQGVLAREGRPRRAVSGSEDAPTNAIVGAGAGVFHAAYVTMTQGALLPADERTPEASRGCGARSPTAPARSCPQSGAEQSMIILKHLQGG